MCKRDSTFAIQMEFIIVLPESGCPVSTTHAKVKAALPQPHPITHASFTKPHGHYANRYTLDKQDNTSTDEHMSMLMLPSVDTGPPPSVHYIELHPQQTCNLFCTSKVLQGLFTSAQSTSYTHTLNTNTHTSSFTTLT